MERIDETGFGGIRVIQKKGFGYGVDSVLLAAFASGETGAERIAEGARIADLGAGCGVIAFILRHKLGRVRITGFDIRSDAVDRSRRACEMNGFTDDIDFICSDIKDIPSSGAYDAVVCNPPYFRRTPDEPAAREADERYIARHETTADIYDFAAAAASMLSTGGSLYMVHRPDRLADIICGMRSAGIEPKTMQLVLPRRGGAANIVLLRGVRGAGSELRLLPDITVHDEAGGYTSGLLKIYER